MWDLESSEIMGIRAEEQAALRGLKHSFQRIQEEYIKEEKRRAEEVPADANDNVVHNLRGALGEMGLFLRDLHYEFTKYKRQPFSETVARKRHCRLRFF
jgi:hypothetical protein